MNARIRSGLELTLNTFFETKHSGADSGTDAPDALRIRAEQLLEEGSTYYDVLQMLCRFWGANFFQAGGQWYFMERKERDGTSMTNYPTNSAGTAQSNSSEDLNFTVSGSDLHRRTTFFSYHEATARFQSTFNYPNYLLKNVDWSEGNKYWDNNGSDAAGSAGYRRITINNGYLTQTVGTTFIDSDTLFDKAYFGFNVQISFSASAPGGSVSVAYCEIKAIHDDGTVNYLNSSFAWTSSQTYITQTVTATASTVQTFNATINTAKVPFTPARFVLTLYFDKDATGSLADIDYVEFGEITIQHLKPDTEDDVFRPEEYSTTDTSGNLGSNLEEEFVIGDTATKYNGIGIFEYYDGTDWLPTNDWNGSGQTIHELRVANLKTQLESRMESYEFSHKYGDSPELYNSIVYNAGVSPANVFTPVFIEKLYRRNAKVKSRSVGIQQLGASVTIDVLTDVYFSARETTATAAPVHGVYKYAVPSNTSSVPWVSDTTPWVGNLIITGDGTGASDSINHMRVDVDAGYIFTTGQTNRELKRYDLDGSNVITGSGGTITAWNLALLKTTQRCVFRSSSSNYDIKVVGYALGSSSTLHTDVNPVGGFAADQSETYLFYISDPLASGNTLIKRLTLADGTETTLVSVLSTTLSGPDGITGAIDEDAGKAFFANGLRVFVMDYPSGSTLTQIVSGTPDGMALDRINQKVIYTTTGGDIRRCNYDGSSDEGVLSLTTALSLSSVDLGL